MSNIPTYEQLMALTDADLIDRYNAQAQNTTVGTGFYLDELWRRAQNRQSQTMLSLTRQMWGLTITIAIAS